MGHVTTTEINYEECTQIFCLVYSQIIYLWFSYKKIQINWFSVSSCVLLLSQCTTLFSSNSIFTFKPLCWPQCSHLCFRLLLDSVVFIHFSAFATLKIPVNAAK